MAHIFKHPENNNKGIIVLTHKEVNNVLPVLIKKNIEKKYFIGVHYGSCQGHVRLNHNISFILGSNKQATFIGHQPKKINLLSRNFTPKVFYLDKEEEKHWDVITVARAIKIKNLKLFLKSVRHIYDSGRKIKVLLVIPTVELENTPEQAPRYDRDIVSFAKQLFTYDELKNITILRLSQELGMMGIPSETISLLMRKSKVFSLLSPSEGGSKVVSESICSGLINVLWKGITGGALEYLTKNNSVLVDSLSVESVSRGIIDAIKKSDVTYSSKEYLEEYAEIVKYLREDYTIDKLKKEFYDMYKEKGQFFDGNLINTDDLNFRLPGHFHQVKWSSGGNGQTADIISQNQVNIFLENLK